MATGQTDRELLLALMRNSGVIPNLDPFTYPQNAPNVPKEFGQEVLEFAQALERNPNRRATGLEEVVELIGKMGVINPLKTAGSLMQLDKPTVERMAQSGVEAAKRAYDDPSGTANRLAQGAKEALLDPVSTAGELSVSDIAGGSGLLSKLAGGSSLTGPALMAAMVPGSDVPRPKRSESMGFKDPNKFGTLEEPTPFSEQDYPYTESVVVEFPDGDTFVDQVKGLNSGHALERAKINFDGAKVRKATRSEELMQEQLDRGENVGKQYQDEIGLTTLNDAYHQIVMENPNVSVLESLVKHFRGGAKDYQPEVAEYRKMLKAQVGSLDDTELARLDRAVQQGFNIDAFHGTKGNITEFDPGLRGVTTDAESSRKGFFFSADAGTANSYARQADASKVRKDQYNPNRLSELEYEQNEIAATIDRMEKNMAVKYPDANQQTIYDMLFQNDDYKKLLKRHDEIEEWIDTGYQQKAGENIMPVKLKLDDPLIHDFKGDSYREQSYNDLLKQAKKNGHDGAIFKNTYDGGPLTDVYVVFEPEQIRSRFAMFDPKDAPNVTVNPNWKEELPELKKLEKRRAFSEKMMDQAYDELQDRNITERKRNELRKQFDIHSDAEYKLSEQIKEMQPKKYAYTGAKNILASAPPVLFPLGVGAAAASYSANKEE